MKRTSLIVVAFVLTLTQLQPTFAVDLSDTKRPSIKVRSIIEPGLPNDVLSVEIEYSDDKNLLRDLQLPFQIERAVQDLEAAPVCKMSVFSLPLQYLSKGEDVTRRQVATNGVKQYFILRYLNQIARVDNGCPYATKALVNGWGFWPFDEPLLTLDMTDEAGNRALWDGVATSTGSLPGNTDGRIARLPFDLSIKKLKSVCSPQIVTGSFNCQLARKALHATVNEGLILDGFGLKQTGLYTAILNNRQLVGNFNQSTQSFDSFESSINNDLRTMIISILAINSPLLPKLEDSSINASVKRYDAYQALVALADLSQTTNIVSLWNDWLLRIKTDAEAKAKAEADAKAKAEADAKAKAEADAKAKADAEANLKYESVLNQYQALMERIRLLKIKYPKETTLIGLEAKMMNLPIIKGSDLTTALYNINSVNSKLDFSEKIWAKTQKTTINCVKGKLTKKVTAINPKCPAGYTKK